MITRLFKTLKETPNITQRIYTHFHDCERQQQTSVIPMYSTKPILRLEILCMFGFELTSMLHIC